MTDSRASTSPCCGSAEKLSGGDWVMAWGAEYLHDRAQPGWGSPGHHLLPRQQFVPCRPGLGICRLAPPGHGCHGPAGGHHPVDHGGTAVERRHLVSWAVARRHCLTGGGQGAVRAPRGNAEQSRYPSTAHPLCAEAARGTGVISTEWMGKTMDTGSAVEVLS